MKEKVQIIFVNGKIYTMVSPEDQVEALCVKDGIIVYTGTTKEVLERYDADQIVDLQGKTMLPGMGDSHMHFFAYCQSQTSVDLGGCRTKEEVIAKLAAKAAETPKGEWVRGSNFDESKWLAENDRLPTKADLDKASTEHPIVMKRVCLHTAVVNSMALEKADIGKDFVFGPGGLVELDKDGMPNGVHFMPLYAASSRLLEV